MAQTAMATPTRTINDSVVAILIFKYHHLSLSKYISTQTFGINNYSCNTCVPIKNKFAPCAQMDILTRCGYVHLRIYGAHLLCVGNDTGESHPSTSCNTNIYPSTSYTSHFANCTNSIDFLLLLLLVILYTSTNPYTVVATMANIFVQSDC